jgi:hypothetical protein
MIVGYNRERSEQSQLLFVLLEWLVMCMKEDVNTKELQAKTHQTHHP